MSQTFAKVTIIQIKTRLKIKQLAFWEEQTYRPKWELNQIILRNQQRAEEREKKGSLMLTIEYTTSGGHFEF